MSMLHSLEMFISGFSLYRPQKKKKKLFTKMLLGYNMNMVQKYEIKLSSFFCTFQGSPLIALLFIAHDKRFVFSVS